MKCKQCSVEFESKRATAQYCSDKCRVEANRNKVSVTDISVTGVSVTEESDGGYWVELTDGQKFYRCPTFIPDPKLRMLSRQHDLIHGLKTSAINMC